MALRKRDKAIIKDLQRFRMMDRDSVAELHFSNMKRPILAANSVLLRLYRDGHIDRNTNFQPFVYLPIESQMKKNSQKINHYLAILETYKEINKLVNIQEFLVEPRYAGKGTVEPDIFLKYRNTDFFIEVQRTVYSEKVMNEKIDRYVNLYHENMFDRFPHVLIISDTHYKIDNKLSFKIFQATSFTSFLNSISKTNHQQQQPKTIKMTI